MNEHEKDDLLSSIWQDQTTYNADLQALIKQAKQQQTKQRLYVAMDVLSLAPFLLAFKITLPAYPYLQILLFMLFVCSAFMVIYFLKLRWFAAFGGIHSSKDFTDKLIQQYKNNARIAKVNKYTGIAMLPVGILSALIVSFADNKTSQDTIYSVGIVSMWMLALMVPWCIWAHKRQKSFEAKHEQLKGLYAPS